MIIDGDRTTAIRRELFGDLLGQQRAKNLLSKSLASGRIAHAYLFRGRTGWGRSCSPVLWPRR